MRNPGRSVVFVAALGVGVAGWPFGCAPAGVPVAKDSPGATASGGFAAAVSKSPIAFLAHPAFAYAQSGGQAVSIADVAQKATPAVVSVASTRVTKRPSMQPFPDDPVFRQFFGPGMGGAPREQRDHGLGSGVIVSADGIVLTNNHVVDKGQEIKVMTADKREFNAKVVGTDEKSDLAVLKLEGDVKGLQPIQLGDSSRLRLADVVLAIGNPFGVGETVTMGIVSAKGRANVGIVDYEDFIQTDAAINPGNSGGALVDMEGNLVGINTAILSKSGGSMGIGFAIPTEMARPIMDSLLAHGKVVRGWLGIGIQDVDQDLARALGLASTDGVLVSDVDPQGPAGKAGLLRGDVVLEIAGQKVDSTGRLRNVVAAAGAGKQVDVKLVRGKEQKSVGVVLGELPAKEQIAETPAGAGEALEGMDLESLSPKARRRFRIPDAVTTGAVVTHIEPGSAAAESGLRPGDVIVEAGKQKIDSVERFRQIYGKTSGTLLLLVQRAGRTVYVVVGR